VHVMRKHRLPASWRHLAPGTFAAALLLFGITAPFVTLSAWILAAMVGVYALLSLSASVIACRQAENIVLLPIMPLVFAAYHLPYGAGFLRGLWDTALHRRPTGSVIELVR
jgi:hypothetical protein